ncbi:uncharacterized protein K460DRAFT_97860 [Cucurbitaria berberidis CBS 394.84]|uniref:Zn(2)-C6 fungal-type domain-containing protein n=1 Tax=Cucurbitaria berberidis CBS 394.84 TaxID=1168544 RepID=A0A9P4L7A9_9PLEO|nr:uncharacterized protein K460DRAFT_97860 [Cucurbitaria berberidis CBS 394.84]KAF1844745.1 hypothetical protein K460DRAFT_97860 [Cucurbitaria berberidis CBS 394.84]
MLHQSNANLLRIRKVKCDEEKPHCKRCTSTGRKCDGYDPNFRPSPPTTPPQSVTSSTRGQLQRLTSRGINRSPSPLYLVPALRFNTVEERESFDFFTSNAVVSLRGFLDSSFWEREVLQAAHREPAIQHCIVALGAMHRRFFEGRRSHINEEHMSDKYLQFALRQSNQAIQDLVGKQGLSGSMVKTDRVTLMTCSILFISMSCLQGYQKDAFEHLRSGIRMLNEMDSEENAKPENHPVDMDSLRSLFIGLDLQARSIMPTAQFRNWVPTPKLKTPASLPNPELNMASLLAMVRYMETLLNHLHAFFQGIMSRRTEETNDIYLEYSDLITRFNRGSAILEILCEKSSSNADEFSQPLTVLRLLQCQIEYLLRSPRSDVEDKFKLTMKSTSFDDLFDEPFDHSTQLVKMFELATRLLPLSSSSSPVFTTTMGALSALWLVAFRAPSTCATLRKRAVTLMLSHPRREGFWDAMVAGRVAQEALRLEQESTQAELGFSFNPTQDVIVPDDLRMIAVAVSYVDDNKRRARVEYVNSRDLKAGNPGWVRWINW